MSPLIALALAAAQTTMPVTGQAPTPTAAPTTTTANPLDNLGGLLGQGIPNVASVGSGNAAGLLGYCVKNNVLSGANATSVLGRLTGKKGVATSPGYAAGQQGEIQTRGGKTFSLDGMRDRVKTQLCGVVLKRAGSFL